MARIVCFADSAALARAVRHELTDREHAIHSLPASRLTEDLRHTVRQLAPDLVLLELNRAPDNPHLFFFLRADQATRTVPIVMLAPAPHMHFHAAALGADGFLTTDFAPNDLRRLVAPLLPAPVPAVPALDLPLRPAPIPARRSEPLRDALRSIAIPALATA
jgi:CheY-like chemotaxis protein